MSRDGETVHKDCEQSGQEVPALYQLRALLLRQASNLLASTPLPDSAPLPNFTPEQSPRPTRTASESSSQPAESYPPSLTSSGRRSGPSYKSSTSPRSDIQWADANLGRRLLNTAAEDSNSPSPNNRRVRRHYIDGVDFILRGLPAELTEEEEAVLTESLLSKVSNRDAVRRYATLTGHRDDGADSAVAERSALRRATATMAIGVFLAVAWLWPCVRRLLRRARRFDRKYQFSHRLLSRSLAAAGSFGRASLALAAAVYALDNGRVGDSVKRIGLYFFDGVVGGAHQGIREGMQLSSRWRDE